MRAFIAAPLIGTIIFLSAVLFTINLTRVEAADTARAVNDAYHNRIVSLIEIYRTDLNSVFRETLRRNIEEFILNPNWLTFGLSNRGDRGGFLSYKEIREDRCNKIKGVTIDIVCSISPTTTVPAKNSFGYGIPAWVEVVKQPFFFEGIRFKPANEDKMKLLNPDVNSYTEIDKYYKACRKLVTENTFDCKHFAEKPGNYQCKDPSGKVIRGCEQGTFFVRVIPAQDPEVYAALPRIVGDDGFGNTVRSGAIAEETMYLPVNIRVYKYDDYALEFYKGLAYGKTPKTNDGPADGIVDGLCFGSEKACKQQIKKRSRGGGGKKDTTQLRRDLAQAFLRGAFRQGTENIRGGGSLPDPKATNEQLTFKFLFRSGDQSCDTTTPECKDVFALPSVEDILKSPLEPRGTAVEVEGQTEPIAYYEENTATFFVFDEKPAFRVRGNTPNKISYTLTLEVDRSYS